MAADITHEYISRSIFVMEPTNIYSENSSATNVFAFMAYKNVHTYVPVTCVYIVHYLCLYVCICVVGRCLQEY